MCQNFQVGGSGIGILINFATKPSPFTDFMPKLSLKSPTFSRSPQLPVSLFKFPGHFQQIVTLQHHDLGVFLESQAAGKRCEDLGRVCIQCMHMYIRYISADPACSRGSASEEELPAARAKKSLQAARARSKKTRKKKQEQEAIPAGPVRPSGPCCLAVAQAPFWVRQLGFLVGSESHVRHSRPWLAGPVPQGPAVWLWRRRRFGSDS